MSTFLAARLAGGFLQPVDGDHLAAAVAEAIKLPLGELDAVKALPGFQRAAASSLSKAWSAGLRLADETASAKDQAARTRLEAMTCVEQEVLACLAVLRRLRLPITVDFRNAEVSAKKFART